jgi:hypothetical protein
LARMGDLDFMNLLISQRTACQKGRGLQSFERSWRIIRECL